MLICKEFLSAVAYAIGVNVSTVKMHTMFSYYENSLDFTSFLEKVWGNSKVYRTTFSVAL